MMLIIKIIHYNLIVILVPNSKFRGDHVESRLTHLAIKLNIQPIFLDTLLVSDRKCHMCLGEFTRDSIFCNVLGINVHSNLVLELIVLVPV